MSRIAVERIEELRQHYPRDAYSKNREHHPFGHIAYSTIDINELVDALESAYAELNRLRSAPVAVEVPEITPSDIDAAWNAYVEANPDILPADDAVETEWLLEIYAHGMREGAKIATPRPISSDRVLKEGEVEELRILREIVQILDEKREANAKRPCVGGQRMPDEIDNLLCELLEIRAHPVLRSQRAAERGADVV